MSHIFTRNCQTVPQSSCTILHSHQKCMSGQLYSPAFDVVTTFYFSQFDEDVFYSVWIEFAFP